MDERQEMERELFLELTSMSVAKAKAELRDIAKNCTQYEIQEKLELLLERRSTIRTHPGPFSLLPVFKTFFIQLHP